MCEVNKKDELASEIEEMIEKKLSAEAKYEKLAANASESSMEVS